MVITRTIGLAVPPYCWLASLCIGLGFGSLCISCLDGYQRTISLAVSPYYWLASLYIELGFGSLCISCLDGYQRTIGLAVSPYCWLASLYIELGFGSLCTVFRWLSPEPSVWQYHPTAEWEFFMLSFVLKAALYIWLCSATILL